MLWRGDDGSLTVYESVWVTTTMPWVVTPVCNILYMRDGRMITYTPEPLRLPPPSDVTVNDKLD